MNATETLRQLRRFLLVLSIVLFVGALAELWLVGHTEDTLQWAPFVLSIGGAIVAGLFLVAPGAGTSRVLRAWMLLVFLGTLVGIYLHVEGNFNFEREIAPQTPASQLIWKSLEGGNPLLAPGVLAVAGILAVAATYRYEFAPSVNAPEVSVEVSSKKF